MTGKLNEKGDINAAALAVYPILTAGILVIFMRGGFRVGYVYTLLFCLIKIVGAGMTIDVQLTSNTSLLTPAAIISTVVLSPLLLGVTSLINPVDGYQHRNPFSRLAPLILRVNHLIIIAALALGIIGGLDIFGTNVKESDIAKSQRYLRIAAALNCIAWAAIVVSVACLWTARKTMGNFYVRLFPIVAFLVMPIFIARLAYTVGIAATIDVAGTTQIFSPLTGSWVIYLLLAFLPEVAIATLLVVAGLVSRKEEYRNVKSPESAVPMQGWQR